MVCSWVSLSAVQHRCGCLAHTAAPHSGFIAVAQYILQYTNDYLGIAHKYTAQPIDVCKGQTRKIHAHAYTQTVFHTHSKHFRKSLVIGYVPPETEFPSVMMHPPIVKRCLYFCYNSNAGTHAFKLSHHAIKFYLSCFKCWPEAIQTAKDVGMLLLEPTGTLRAVF